MKPQTEPSHDQKLRKLGQLIKAIKFGMVTSIDDKNQLHSCPMTTQQVDYEGDLWFVVGKNTDLYKNVKVDPRVNISYASEKYAFISITGTATIVEDRAMIEKFWSPAYKVWFERGINDPNVGLIQIFMERAEYWEAPSFAITRWVALAKALFTGNKNSLGEHHKINLN